MCRYKLLSMYMNSIMIRINNIIQTGLGNFWGLISDSLSLNEGEIVDSIHRMEKRYC